MSLFWLYWRFLTMPRKAFEGCIFDFSWNAPKSNIFIFGSILVLKLIVCFFWIAFSSKLSCTHVRQGCNAKAKSKIVAWKKLLLENCLTFQYESYPKPDLKVTLTLNRFHRWWWRMLETKSVGDKFEMVVTSHVTNIKN